MIDARRWLASHCPAELARLDALERARRALPPGDTLAAERLEAARLAVWSLIERHPDWLSALMAGLCSGQRVPLEDE